MKTLAVDMDGVIADVYAVFFKNHYADFGELLSAEDVCGKKESEAFPNCRKYVFSNGFFRQAPVMAGSEAILKKLNDKYKLFIVSAAMEFPQSLAEKQSWLNEHFPFIRWEQMVFCGSKEIINADIMIDDQFRNLDYFTGHTILFTQPHNKLAENGRHQRVESWSDIEKILLP
ncbi:MAG TPA: 5'(3')-deoxyribonucleotidase [Chitinophagaceae bacterium]|jgi:Uncharacterized protein conserved in bacteria